MRKRNEVKGLLHFVQQGEPIAWITRITLGDPIGKDKTRGGFGDNPGFAPELRRAVALPLDNRCDGRIIGIDDFILRERFALGQPLRLFGDVPMRIARHGQVA